MLLQNENIKMVMDKIDEIVSCSHKSIYILIDGDGTLILNDTTKYLLQFLNLKYTDIKNIFMQYGYTFEAFYNVGIYYSKIERRKYNAACIESASCVNVYPDFISFIDMIKDKAEIILITSGVLQIWKNIISNHSLEFMHLIGGNFPLDGNFLIDKQAKGLVIDRIKELGGKVFAFGDAMIDFEMLQKSNHSYLVVNKKHNKDFIPFANKIPHLKQISFSNYFHSNISSTNLINIQDEILKLQQ